jgi:flagellar basal body-associated protein FliL
MKKSQALLALVLVVLIAAVPLAQAATLSKPNVTLPSEWTLKNESPYPNAPSEHDTAGAGKVEYYNPVNYDDVKIYYENAPSTTYDAASLEAEASNLFQTELTSSNVSMQNHGTKQVAGVTAGYAYGYDSSVDAYLYDYVFVKDNVYYNVIAYYDANTSSESAVTSLMNSISMGGSSSGLGSMLYIIIAVVVVIVVVVVVLVVVMSRKKKTQQQQMPPQPMVPDINQPPPPPPTV